ncbi:hypothetical protein [Anaerotardibacter muris]|uniref:hypothetical protein n=1 Tax=Anaerotardibacter muris TaxID=2941505 RepID=UPI00203B6B6A|nr:hypothetical protein [Anaerotardibacter muris]
MNEDTNFGNLPSHDNSFNDSSDYLKRAAYAVESGDQLLGIHLYLAAFEQSMLENIVPSDETIGGMRKAWDLAVSARQHSLAEYIFEKLKPYVSPDELAHKADELQDIALDRLEEFGFSREAIEDMAELINEDLMGLSPDLLYRFEKEGVPSPFSMFDFGSAPADQDFDPLLGPAAEAEPEEGPRSPEEEAAQNAAAKEAGSENKDGEEDPIELSAFPLPSLKGAKIAHIDLSGRKKQRKKKKPEPTFDYSTIRGFSRAIEKMGHLGVGRMRDPEFKEFVKMLNFRHGVSRMPQLGTLVFSSQAREDANYFMVATVGEMGIPAVRMRMDHNMQGQSVLCVMASSDQLITPNGQNRLGQDGPAALILEDLDLWDLPWMDMGGADLPDFLQMQLSRGAREALSFIQSALENPEVTVLISASNLEALDALFGPMLGLYRVVELEYPNDEERRQIWRAAQSEHPSMRGLDVMKLVPFSKGLSRFELYTVITESVEEAYRRSVAKDCFCAVRSDDVYMRLSTFHELDSKEYKDIESEIMQRFQRSMDHIDDLLKED